MASTQQASLGDNTNTESHPRLLVCLLGGFRLLHEGKPLHISKKGAALLCVLARRGGSSVSREAILADLWPDNDPQLAGRSLNTLLWSLHRRLAPFLEAPHNLSSTSTECTRSTPVGVSRRTRCHSILSPTLAMRRPAAETGTRRSSCIDVPPHCTEAISTLGLTWMQKSSSSVSGCAPGSTACWPISPGPPTTGATLTDAWQRRSGCSRPIPFVKTCTAYSCGATSDAASVANIAPVPGV